MMPNGTSNTNAVFTYDNCTFGVSTEGGSVGYVNCNGGTHIFNNCTFDFTGGLTYGSGAAVKWNAVNSYSETGRPTSVILNGCTFVNCSTNRFGPSSGLTVK